MQTARRTRRKHLSACCLSS